MTLFFGPSPTRAIAVRAPYNPDGNADGIIGVEDLMELLAVFGLSFQPKALWANGPPADDVAIVDIGGRDTPAFLRSRSQPQRPTKWLFPALLGMEHRTGFGLLL